jgi:glutathione S-transferase
MPTENRLVTIVFSHYNEKARWALDYAGVDYVERPFMPGFSHLGVLLATRGRGGRADGHSSRLSTPVLVTREGERLCDSTDIARWASARAGEGAPGPLFPEPAVDELVARFGKTIGPRTRLIAYWHAFRSKTALQTMADRNVSPRQALAFRVIAPLGAAFIKRGIGVDDASKERALEKVRAELAAVEELLGSRRYLVGDTFTAADLTFASLMAPALLITREEGYGASMCDLDELGPEARELVTEIRASRAGAFALEMFRRHRHERYRRRAQPLSASDQRSA